MFEDELKSMMAAAQHLVLTYSSTHKLEHEETKEKGDADNRGNIEGRYPISNG